MENAPDEFHTPSGYKAQNHRHRVIMDFFQLLNTGRDLRQVEQIEHYLEETTVRHLEILTQIFNENPSLLSLYQKRSGQADSR